MTRQNVGFVFLVAVQRLSIWKSSERTQRRRKIYSGDTTVGGVEGSHGKVSCRETLYNRATVLAVKEIRVLPVFCKSVTL